MHRDARDLLQSMDFNSSNAVNYGEELFTVENFTNSL